MALAKPIFRDGKYFCPCGKNILIDALKGCAVRIFTHDSAEFEIIFDQIKIRCPKCDNILTIESPLLALTLLTQNKEMIRIKANLLDRDKLGLNLPRLSKKERNRFDETLIKEQKVIYRILRNPDLDLAHAVKDIATALKLNLVEAQIQCLLTATLLMKFQLIAWLEGKKKLLSDKIIELYESPKKLHGLYTTYEKSLGKDSRDLMLTRMQKQIYYIPINAWARAIRELRET